MLSQIRIRSLGKSTLAPLSRSFSSEKALVEVERKDSYAIVRMNNGAVNPLSTAMAKEMSKTVKELEKEKGVRGIVLTSKHGGVFSAGLDITAMYQKDMEELRDFWTSIQDLFTDVYASELAVVAAVNGHAPAGGCMLSMCSDYSIMQTANASTPTRPYTIGLNETQLGIAAPFWLTELYVERLGVHRASVNLQLGTLMPAEKAHTIGLVDALCNPEDEIIARAEAALQPFLKVPPFARAASKKFARARLIERMEEFRGEDLQHFMQFIQQENVQKSIGMYLESLAKRKQ